MIKTPKKPLYNTTAVTAFPAKISSLRTVAYLILFCILYIVLPAYLTVAAHFFSLHLVLIFYLADTIIIYWLLRRFLSKRNQQHLSMQDLQEKINIIKDEISSNNAHQDAILAKIIRYNRLKEIIEKINASLALDSVADNLVGITYSLLADDKGTCIIYLVDPRTKNLSLFKTKKEDPKLIIKSKEGDIFDLWVTKHASPLLIENIKDDFRFDLEKIESQEARPISSLISAALISENNFLGLLRLDSLKPRFYSLDDLRVLVTICDLGAVALENAELFQKIHDLAIHDGLTTLYTKGYFLERLKEEQKRSARQRAKFSLLMLDIDRFKDYNDKFGHIAGDLVLKTLSTTILDFLKGLTPVVSRFGGEEFCIILPHIDKKEAHIVAEELRAKIEMTRIILRRQEATITVSIGVAAFPSDAEDEDEIILKADRAMYEAKQNGRNLVVDSHS